MKDLMLTEGVLTMDSREIAEMTGKEHRKVCRDIEEQLGQLEGGVARFGHTYIHEQNGQEYPCFKLPKRECLILVSGYSIELRAAIIDRWAELESKDAKPMSMLDIMAGTIAKLQEQERKNAEIDGRLKALENNRLPIPANADEEYAIPTILGKMFDPQKSAQGVNALLKANGLQYKAGGEWVPSEEGRKWSKVFPTVVENGKVIYQVMWKRGVLKAIE